MTYSQAKQRAVNELEFNAERHRYSLRGLLIPNVTTLIDDMLPFQHMPKERLEEARQRGNAVHTLTACMDIGQGLPREEGPYLPYLKAWWKFRNETGFVPLEVEARVFHRRHLFAGTLDRVGMLDEELSVLDIKTGALYPQYALQLAAYLAAANDGRVGPKVTGRRLVQLKDDGTYALSDPKMMGRNDFNVFLANLLVYQWKEKVHVY